MFPYIQSRIVDIKNIIPADLPICIFQTKGSPVRSMITVVPFKASDGNTIKTRVISSGDISRQLIKIIAEFSQAFLFLLNVRELPSPHEENKLTNALITLTDKRLFKG